MSERDYSHRTAIDKLGLKPGMRVRMTGDIGAELKSAAKLEIGGSLLRSGELDLIVRVVKSVAEADEFLGRVRDQIVGDGAIWLVTWKRGDPRYVMQEELIPLGPPHRLVDNKVCAIDDRRSAIRFVIPRELRL
ncbi:MAG: hypothetical protein WAO61_04590 [Solirubrobacterales bacterium]